MWVMAARSPNVQAAESHQQEKPELDATEMPSICAGEAAEGPDDEAEHGDGGRPEGGDGLAERPPDLRPEGVSGPDQGGQGGTVQREEEGSDEAQEQDRPAAEAGAVPQREAPEGAGREMKGTVVKALFTSTPKKETPAKSQAPPVAEVCSKMKKLNLARREVPSRYLAQLSTPNKTTKKCEETTAAVKRVQQPRTGKKILGLSAKTAKCGNAEAEEGNQSDRQIVSADENSCKRSVRCKWERKEALHGSRIEVEPLQPDNHGDDENDKENVPCGDQLTEGASNRQDENVNQLENNENAPQKMVKRQNNKVNESSRKPFRGHLG